MSHCSNCSGAFPVYIPVMQADKTIYTVEQEKTYEVSEAKMASIEKER